MSCKLKLSRLFVHDPVAGCLCTDTSTTPTASLLLQSSFPGSHIINKMTARDQ